MKKSKSASTLVAKASKECKECIFFAGKAIPEKYNFFTKFLDNDLATAVQDRLHATGLQMVILPMQLG